MAERATGVLVETADGQAASASVSAVLCEVAIPKGINARVSGVLVEYTDQPPPPVRISSLLLEIANGEAAFTRPSAVLVEIAGIFGEPDEEDEDSLGVWPSRRRPVRRLRQAPHVSHEQRWLHYSRLQLDLEAGQGLTRGQGEDPQLMLQWSDDGGRTWSSEHWVSAGRLGQYKWRAIWRRLGRSRNRVYRIVQSDPTKVAWIQAFLDLDGGTS